jgi:hypothetical protein
MCGLAGKKRRVASPDNSMYKLRAIKGVRAPAVKKSRAEIRFPQRTRIKRDIDTLRPFRCF